jgi:hypothetical protein
MHCTSSSNYEICIARDKRIYSFHISNIYTNIPAESHHYNTNYVKQPVHNKTQSKDRKHSIQLLQFNKEYYRQEEGLAIGIQSSAILAEIYIQFLEHN